MRNSMITMEDFIPEADPILRAAAEPVEFPLSEDLKETAMKMRQFLINSQDAEIAEEYGLRPGVGVAAPQIGLSKQLFAIYITDFDEDGNPTDPTIDEIMINPKVLSHSVQRAALKEGEGCLSVPREVPGIVPRPKRVTIEFQTTDGTKKTVRLKDYEAVVIQHEIDHLKGIMFYDHINSEDPWKQEEDVTLI